MTCCSKPRKSNEHEGRKVKEALKLFYIVNPLQWLSKSGIGTVIILKSTELKAAFVRPVTMFLQSAALG
jgi:hypothetical protein